LYFRNAEEKNLGKFIELFTQKIATKLSKIWVWDAGSGKKPIPDPRVKKAPDPGSATLLFTFRINFGFELSQYWFRVSLPVIGEAWI
jgi:hypothetical protein